MTNTWPKSFKLNWQESCFKVWDFHFTFTMKRLDLNFLDFHSLLSRIFCFSADPVSKRISQLTGCSVSQFSIFCCTQLRLASLFASWEPEQQELKKTKTLKVNGRKIKDVSLIERFPTFKKNMIVRKKAWEIHIASLHLIPSRIRLRLNI